MISYQYVTQPQDPSWGHLKIKYKAASRLIMAEMAKMEGKNIHFQQAVQELLKVYQTQHPELKVDLNQPLDYSVSNIKLLTPSSMGKVPTSIFEVTYQFYFRK